MSRQQRTQCKKTNPQIPKTPEKISAAFRLEARVSEPERRPCVVRTSLLCFTHSRREFILTSLLAAAREGINDEISLDRLNYRDQQQLVSNFDKYTLKTSSTRDGMFE